MYEDEGSETGGGKHSLTAAAAVAYFLTLGFSGRTIVI